MARHALKLLAGIGLIILSALPLFAQAKTSVAILPFTVHSGENIDYVQQGIWDMMTTRVSINEKIDVVPKEKVTEALKTVKSKDLTATDITALSKALSADFIVYGTITKIGSSTSIDGKLLEIKTSRTPVVLSSSSQGMDDVINKVNDFSQRIEQTVAGSAPAVVAAGPATVAVAAPSMPKPGPALPAGVSSGTRVQESQIVSRMRSGRGAGTLTAAINPDFISGSMPLDRKGFWLSQKYPTKFVGMDVGDVNGDGKNEIVAIDMTNIYIFQRRGNSMNLLEKVRGEIYDKYIGVDVYDVDNDGIAEILVTDVVTRLGADDASNTITSFILKWKDGKYQVLAKDLPWMFRVIGRGKNARLLGQQLGVSGNYVSSGTKPFNESIYEVVWRSGKIEEFKKVPVPRGTCVFGFNLDNLGEGAEKIITYNEYDRLMILEQTDKDLDRIMAVMNPGKELLYQTEDEFGGSNNYIEMYGELNPGEGTVRFFSYLNPRIQTYDVNKNGKPEIIAIKNLSPMGRVLKNVKAFTGSEFYNLEWDALGLVENWHTKKMPGYVSDYQIKDLDGDGEDEIIMSMVTSVGSMLGNESVIASYKLILTPEGKLGRNAPPVQ